MSGQAKPDFTSADSRRSASSMRRMSAPRRLYYFLGLPLLRGLIKLLNWTYRYEPVIGQQFIEPYIGEDLICAPCFWHQQHVLC